MAQGGDERRLERGASHQIVVRGIARVEKDVHGRGRGQDHAGLLRQGRRGAAWGYAEPVRARRRRV